MKRIIVRSIMVFLMLILTGAIVAAYVIETAIETVEKNIEQRALPVLRIDIPKMRDSLLEVVPQSKNILKCIPFCSTLAEHIVDRVKWPIIKKALSRTRDDLNKELSYVKVIDLEYAEEEKVRTITAYCTYGIKVILTGEYFNDIVSVHRPTWFTLVFTCN